MEIRLKGLAAVSAGALGEASHEKREANASVLKERCDNLSGQAKSDCQARARQVARGETGRTGGTGGVGATAGPGSTGGASGTATAPSSTGSR